MLNKIIILALGLTLALACKTYNYDMFKNGNEKSTDGCDGSVCLANENCVALYCNNPPTEQEIKQWFDDYNKGNKYDLRLGSCGKPEPEPEKPGLGTGAIIGIVIGALVVVGGGIAGFMYYRRKKSQF